MPQKKKARCIGTDPSIKVLKCMYRAFSYHPTQAAYTSFAIFSRLYKKYFLKETKELLLLSMCVNISMFMYSSQI